MFVPGSYFQEAFEEKYNNFIVKNFIELGQR